MRIELHGLVFDTRRVTVHLWSPWRATALEHRVFEAIREAVAGKLEQAEDEYRFGVDEARAWKAAMESVERVLKGWQEEADAHSERRSWWWLLEGDTDANGYDHNGEATALWCLIRVGLDRGGLGEQQKSEDFDLEGFAVKIWGRDEGMKH